MRYLRVISDVHLDWYAYEFTRLKYPVKDGRRILESEFLWAPEPMEEDSDTCLVLPGDIWSGNRAFEPRYGNPDDFWLKRVAARFKYVVLVLGNHDFWGESLQRAPEKAKLHGLPNVHVLEQSSVVLDQWKFVGGTLWTDYNDGDSLVLGTCSSIMRADHERIRFQTRDAFRGLRTPDLFEVHRQTKRYIANNAVRDAPEQKLMVVTHMAPSYQSVNPMFRTPSESIANFTYHSNLDQFVLQYQDNIDLWVHGHMHLPSDYTIGKVRVLCNPKGYMSETSYYDPWLRIDADTLEVVRTPDLETL